MVDTIGKLDLFQIQFEAFEISVVTVAVIVLINVLDEVADCKVILAVLVPKNVASGQSRFGEIIYKYTLLRSEIFKVRYFVAKHLDIGKTVDCVVEVSGVSSLVGFRRA